MRRSQTSDRGLALPDGPLRSRAAPATSRKALANSLPTRPCHAEGLTRAAGRLQSPQCTAVEALQSTEVTVKARLFDIAFIVRGESAVNHVG